MPVVPLNKDFSNTGEFVNSLFSPDVRSLSVLSNAITQGEFTVSFSDQSEKILDVWLTAWRASQGGTFDPDELAKCPQSDRTLLAQLAFYLALNKLVLFVPQIQYQGMFQNTDQPIYQLDAYDSLVFQKDGAWDYGVVRRFLELLLYGAHTVVISDAKDIPGESVEPFYRWFQRNASLKPEIHRDIGNSHYTSLTSFCGKYYPDSVGGTAPAQVPFILAYLVGPTVQAFGCNPSSYETFFQLEGWQSPWPRHMADYDAYNQTLWNISTYGACAYSEKRATACFLAPASWDPKPQMPTYMPPYVGAETPQKWLDTNLVTLGPSA